MARPFKQGVDYFPLNVHMDNKVKFVEIKFGLEGFAVIVKILQHIYDNGYWVEWREDDQLLFCSDIKMDFERYEQIFTECMKREIFSRFMYEEHKILTSTGIQKRYKEMVRRRKDVSIVTEYLLIDNIISVNDGNNSDNDDAMNTQCELDDGKSTQRKEKGNRNETIKDMPDESDLAFEEWYKSYPKGRSVKKPSLAKWKTLWREKKIDTEEMKRGTEAYLKYQQSNGYDVCGAQVFLNQERWKDEWDMSGGVPNGPKQYASYKQDRLSFIDTI